MVKQIPITHWKNRGGNIGGNWVIVCLHHHHCWAWHGVTLLSQTGLRDNPLHKQTLSFDSLCNRWVTPPFPVFGMPKSTRVVHLLCLSSGTHGGHWNTVICITLFMLTCPLACRATEVTGTSRMNDDRSRMNEDRSRMNEEGPPKPLQPFKPIQMNIMSNGVRHKITCITILDLYLAHAVTGSR